MKLDSLLISDNRRLVLTVYLCRQTSSEHIRIAIFAVFLTRICIFSWLLSVIYGHLRSVSDNSVRWLIILLMMLESLLLVVRKLLWGLLDSVRWWLKRARACFCSFEHQVGGMLSEKLTMWYYLVTWIHETILRWHCAHLIMVLIILRICCIIQAILILDNIFIQFDPASSLFNGRTVGSVSRLVILGRLLKIWRWYHHWR